MPCLLHVFTYLTIFILCIPSFCSYLHTFKLLYTIEGEARGEGEGARGGGGEGRGARDEGRGGRGEGRRGKGEGEGRRSALPFFENRQKVSWSVKKVPWFWKSYALFVCIYGLSILKKKDQNFSLRGFSHETFIKVPLFQKTFRAPKNSSLRACLGGDFLRRDLNTPCVKNSEYKYQINKKYFWL